MRVRFNKITCGFFAFLLGILPALARADVETITVHAGDVVSKNIAINPGFAVMFQFPNEVVSLTLADQTAFACDKMPNDSSRVLCKPLTQSPFATNLVASTEANEFNLILNVDPDGGKHPFKYVFSDGKSTNRAFSTSSYSTPKQGSSEINIMNLMMDHYETKPCRLKGTSSYARFDCLEVIEIGAEQYLRFSISGHSSSPIRIVKLVLNHESLGGLTGLAVKDEASTELDYSIKNDSLRNGDETYGVIKLPHQDGANNNRSCLVVMTDQGTQGDIRIYGL